MGAAGRINVIATALEARMRVDGFEQLDLAYSPPFSHGVGPGTDRRAAIDEGTVD